MSKKTNEQKILLVDDNAKNLQVAMAILKEFNVVYAQTATKALELVKEKEFDLILLDVVMPNLDGYEVCKILKSDEKTKDIPIIFLTVKDDESDILKGFELGAVDYVTKPFYPAVLLKRVSSHLLLAQSLKDLKKLNEGLEHKVQEQIEEIRQKDKLLFNQTKMSALSEMVDTISNRLKYPLGLIKLQSQALELKAFNTTITVSDINDFSTEIIEQVNDLEHNIEDFRQFFSDTKSKQSINLNVLIDSIVFSLRDNLIRQNIKTTIDGDISLNVNFATEELRYIFSKFIKNSIYAFSRNSCCDKKINFNISEDDSFVYVKYEDNAGGVNIENIENIFDSSYTTKKNGSGIGLYLTKLFIEKNDGDISVKNRENGICFVLKFSKAKVMKKLELPQDSTILQEISFYEQSI